MSTRKASQQNIRKLTRVGGTSLAVTLPAEIVQTLKWKDKQKVVVKRKGRHVLIKDWKR